jgi:hypothetical protein
MSGIRSVRVGRWSASALAATMLALLTASSAFGDVTGAADDLRTAWYPDEPTLTHELLGSGSFGQTFSRSLKGQIYAQPLTADGTLLVATEDDRVYGLDPYTGATRWELNVGTPVNSSDADISCSDLEPHVGITGTPVIDTESNTAYFVSTRYVSPGSSEASAWYMHAVKLSTGEEAPGFPVLIAGKAQNLPGNVQFQPPKELQRPALLLMNGVVYAAFGSHCDKTPYQGWVAGVSTSGELKTLWAASAYGGSIWQSGGGLISDGPGQILFTTGNEDGEGGQGNGDPPVGQGHEPPEGRLGESVVRVGVQPEGNLLATDFFSPSNNVQLDEFDLDVGSSAPIALPSQFGAGTNVPSLLVQDGKQGYVYLLDRSNLGGMGQVPGETDGALQRLGPYGGVWDASAAWPGDGGYVYIPSVSPGGVDSGSSGRLRFFKYEVDEKTDEPTLSLAATSPESFGFGSGSPIVTSAGTTNGSGVLWITRCPPSKCNEGELVAYNPVPTGKESLQILWHAPIGIANKFSRPDAAEGHIYVGNWEGKIIGFAEQGLTPSTSSLDLGEGQAGADLAGEVTLINASATKLNVSAVRTPAQPFEASGLPAPGSTIEPGQTITVHVAFHSSQPGEFTGSLALTTQAGETTIALSALATAPPASEPTPPAGGGATTTTTTTLTTPILGTIATVEQPPILTRLHVASTTSRHRRALRVTYELSAAGTVELRIYRRVISHRCKRGAHTCIHYLATPVQLKRSAHRHANAIVLALAGLPAGHYRLAATPIEPSGTASRTRYAPFTLSR